MKIRQSLPNLSFAEKSAIVNAWIFGEKSYENIANKAGCDPKTVQRIVEYYKKHKCIKQTIRTGRPRKFGGRHRSWLKHISQKEESLSNAQIAARFKIAFNQSISKERVRGILKDMDIVSYVKKPMSDLTEKHRQVRLQFCK